MVRGGVCYCRSGLEDGRAPGGRSLGALPSSQTGPAAECRRRMRRSAMSVTDRPVRRWTVSDYHRAADAGVFGPEERLELIDGEIICMSPQKGPHLVGI